MPWEYLWALQEDAIFLWGHLGAPEDSSVLQRAVCVLQGGAGVQLVCSCVTLGGAWGCGKILGYPQQLHGSSKKVFVFPRVMLVHPGRCLADPGRWMVSPETCFIAAGRFLGALKIFLDDLCRCFSSAPERC